MYYPLALSSVSAVLLAACAYYYDPDRDASSLTPLYSLFNSQPHSHSSANTCCETINIALPNTVHYAGSPEYDSRQASFYAGISTTLLPACRVLPRTSSDVSAIVKVAAEKRCRFAVASGGHMVWGSSNIDKSGFNLDLAGLDEKTMTMSEARDGSGSVAHVGPGNRWRDVYKFTLQHDRIVLGGRCAGVGVGGYLLGGGIHYLNYQHGWSSANILRYELVLSNGSIIHASTSEHPDLYRALKWGSSNYGIVTRYDLATYETGDVWGGQRLHGDEDTAALLDNLVEYTRDMNEDPTTYNALGLMYKSDRKGYILWSPIVSTAGPEEWPSGFQKLKNVGRPFLDSTRRANYSDLAEEVEAGFLGGRPVDWWTLNIKVDRELMWDIFEKGKEIFGPYLEKVVGLDWMMITQPIPACTIRASKKNGGDLSGLEEIDQWVILAGAQWNHTSDNALVEGLLRNYLTWSEQKGSERGSLLPFIYMNYAGEFQDVMRSFGKENVEKMKEVQKVYDPELVWSKIWKGGYRL